MNDAQHIAGRYRRLKWILIIVSIALVTTIEVLRYRPGGNLLEHILVWSVELLALLLLFLMATRELSRLHDQLNRQLDESRAQSLRQAVLIQLNTKLAASHDESEICQLLVTGLQEVLVFAHLEVFLIDRASGNRMRYPVVPGVEPDSDYDGMVRRARLEIPLRAGQERLGGLVVDVDKARGISEAEHSLLVSAANLAVSALTNARLIHEQRRQRLDSEEREAEQRDRERSLSLFSDITQAALGSEDYPAMLQALADNLANAFEADGVLILLLEEGIGRLQGEAAFGPLRPSARSMQYDPVEMILGKWVLDSGQAVAIQDALVSPLIHQRVAADLHSRSLLALPLVAGNEKLGLAIISYQSEHRFTPQEIGAGEQAARQMALAISKGRALATAQYRAQELDALQKATAALLITLDLEKLLGQILDAAISAISVAYRGTLHLTARDTGQLQVRAVQGYTDARIRALSRSGDSHTARAVRERRPLLVHSALAETVAGQGEVSGMAVAEAREAVSAIIAPLLLGDDVLGAISLESYRPHAFTQADLQLLVSFAATATTAIHNAQLHGEVQKQAITDTLTGLYNRRGFFELGRREVERALRFSRPLTAIMLDIDYFKNINDLYGHLVGDRVLIGLASRLLQELRQIDLVGRYGGDEFVALLPETDLTNAVSVAERLRKVAAGVIIPSASAPVKISLSAGVATLNPESKDLNSLLHHADQALYEAKRAGRDQVLSL
jgi:diguanylate cyclase (GGDEF)-like protein